MIFTNLSHEHLNTHKNMESYFNCKKILLKLLKPNGIVITNIEDFYGRKLVSNKSINYGLHKGKVRTITFSLESNFTRIFLKNDDRFYYYKIPFVGVYNIYNFLCVHATISHLFNISNFTFNNLKTPDGRFCVIDKNIIIDFAHTPNALENLLITIKEIYKYKKIILILGSQGEKDKSKRKKLGMIADKYADYIILTSEDPKNESLINIIFDISLGITKDLYTIKLSRKEAILLGLKMNNTDSVLVIVGKGAETTEQHKNITYNHSDFLFVKEKNQVKLPDF